MLTLISVFGLTDGNRLNRQTGRDSETGDRQAGMQTDGDRLNKQASRLRPRDRRQTGRQAGRQTDRQTETD